MKNVGLTADLAVFDITLPAAGGDIHLRFVPLAAAGALESGLHDLIIWSAGGAIHARHRKRDCASRGAVLN